MAETPLSEVRASMEWPDVQRGLASGEDAGTEFKRAVGDLRGVGKAVCGFANGNGGLVVIGVDDAGVIVGDGENAGTVQERLARFLGAGCGMPVTAECGRHEAKGRWVHWVDVHRDQRGYEAFSCDGRFWVRRGRSTEAPSPSELQELLNAVGLVLTEKQIIPSATVDDIDFGAVRGSCAPRVSIRMRYRSRPGGTLRNASIVDELEGLVRPTLYGLMVFGRDPQAYAYTLSLFVQCTAYEGTDQAADVLSAGECKGPAAGPGAPGDGVVSESRSAGDERGHPARRHSAGAEAALREALVNAVIHRDYAITGSQVLLEVFDERIVVTSPGALPNHMTVDQARKGGAPRSRNEMMANAMVVGGLMERRGRGWLTMRHAMRRFNGTEPELISDGRNRLVRVTFERGPRNA